MDTNTSIKLILLSIYILIFLKDLKNYLIDIDKIHGLIKLITRKSYILHIFVVILFIIYVYKFKAKGLISNDHNNYKLNKLKSGIKKSFFGLLIALIAYMDLTISAFWIIFLTNHFYDGFI